MAFRVSTLIGELRTKARPYFPHNSANLVKTKASVEVGKEARMNSYDIDSSQSRYYELSSRKPSAMF